MTTNQYTPDEPQFEERMEMGNIKNSEARLWGTDEYEPYYLPQLVEVKPVG